MTGLAVHAVDSAFDLCRFRPADHDMKGRVLRQIVRSTTAGDAGGWAVDDVLIWGKDVGVLLQGDVDLEGDGDFSVVMVLESQAPWPGG